jgi:hypothetical protein
MTAIAFSVDFPSPHGHVAAERIGAHERDGWAYQPR